MIRVTAATLPAARAFLERDLTRAMFPLANLSAHGLDGDAPRSPRIWALGSAEDPRGLLTLTAEGMVMPVLPNGGAEAAAVVLRGQSLIGVIGPTDQVRAVERATSLTSAPRTLDHDENQFDMDLSDLVVPDGPGELIPIGEADRDLMIDWREDYEIRTLGTPPVNARAEAAADVDDYIAADSHRVLVKNGVPLCQTGFNARLPDIVQIGGVYTPPDLRGQGHARRAVGLHLAEARKAGVTRATLFASGASAESAYHAVGFRRIGDWTLLLFDGPQVAHG
jgi:GNAT superfamily N-acetyltransferase